MSREIGCFTAYPSYPPSLVETLEEAINQIEQSGLVHISSWKSTSVTGKFVITEICKSIEASDVFICDLTNLNHNVLFELGFAIARNKRIWILLNPSIETSKVDYDKFKILTTVGYVPYINVHEICDAFYRDQPYKDLEGTIYRDAIESVTGNAQSNNLLYLKSAIETDASVKLSRRIRSSMIPVIVDDPVEVRIQTLSWYAQKVFDAYIVVAHFLSNEHEGQRIQNAKNSFVSGLACGFNKHLLMLAHAPYKSPIDYRDLLGVHSTAAQCEAFVESWLQPLEIEHSRLIVTIHDHQEDLKAHVELRSISIGDPVAENESKNLPDYFVETSAYYEALGSKHSIIIGRKGSGKTAILYMLEAEIGSDARNQVCIIQPVAYELEGILRMLQQALPISEKGYLIESLWKYLLYTELAKSIYESLRSKPAYYKPSDSEEELLSFIKENQSIVLAEFSIRLESTVIALQDIGTPETGEQQRIRISELLHDKEIVILRNLLGEVLKDKLRVVVLIDNLDKAWKQREDLPTLCELLLGLLGVSRRIVQDFEKSGFRKPRVNLSLVMFLRSDIFTQVIKYARERDKIVYSRIAWDDPSILIRVLEERFFSISSLTESSDIWSRYFCDTVQGIKTKEYLTQAILPRPRDLIYFAKTAIAQAVNLRKSKVEEQDILEAHKKYSQYALDSIIVENSIQVEALEALLYEFTGATDVVDMFDIAEAMERSSIPKARLDEVVNLLCDLTFLGREISEGEFKFLYNDEERAKMQTMARKTVQMRGEKSQRFRINPAFHDYLEITPT